MVRNQLGGEDPACGGAIWPLHGAAWRTYGDCICPHSPASMGKKDVSRKEEKNKLAGDAQGVYVLEEMFVLRYDGRRRLEISSRGIAGGVTMKATHPLRRVT